MEQQQPGIDKKAIAAILLCAVIWAVYLNLNHNRRAEQLAAQQKAAKANGAAVSTTGGSLAMDAAAILGATPGATPLPSLGVLAAAEAPERTMTLENPVLAITFSSLGARPMRADLKESQYEHLSDKQTDKMLGGLFPEPGHSKLEPLAPWFGDDDESRVPHLAPFAVVSSSENAVVFRWRSNDGLEVTREYRRGDRYGVELVETWTNTGTAPIAGRPGIVWAAHVKKEKASARAANPFLPAAAVADRFQYEDPGKGEEEIFGGDVKFIAIHDRYFAGIVAPVEPPFSGKDAVRLRRIDDETVASIALGEKTTLAPGQSLVLKHDVYVLPKDYAILRGEKHDLRWVMNWGQGQGFFWAFIGTLTKGLWYALHWFHSLVGNWGIAIIMLTLIMRGLLWPIAARQMRTANEFSMKVQKLKPQLDKLREKHADDPMEMNKQTMVLYKQHGVSPFSPLAGCLPLLAQLPIWWALYALLNTSIDLKGAPFALWIQDLSQADPYKIMPVLLGGVTWLQMKLTPNAGADPVQQKMMMYMMPVMFTFFMWSLPAGLVVYIFTSTLMGIAQQWLLKRRMNPQGPPAVPAKEVTS